MKTYNSILFKLTAFVKLIIGKLQIRSILIILLLFVHETLFAQNEILETGLFTYSDFIVIILILLIATVFIGMEKFDDPKYEIQNQIPYNNSQVITDSFISQDNVFDKSVFSKLKIAVFITCILLIMYAALMLISF
ncbi:MAG TPA: hypothetical protein PK294_10375 [Ignavibacteria bacterium]|nr:hypothetical protein [Ignavibacteria bacterium]HQY52858.1 hypothetical protein [Ignavibacteria bacterium]HRB00829.1 hypothetical protein [Ignavibacteria bacterium]